MSPAAVGLASKRIVWPLTCRGFFSEYNVALWMLLHARLNGLDFELWIDENSMVSPGLAAQLFSLPIGQRKPRRGPLEGASGLLDRAWQRLTDPFSIDPPALFRRLWRRGHERKLRQRIDPLEALHALHEEVWRGCARFQPSIISTMQRIGLDDGSPFVALHIRRGDKLRTEAQYVGPADFLALIPTRLAQAPILVCTDDHEAFLELRDYLASIGRANQLATTAGEHDRGHDEAAFIARGLAERDRAIETVVADFCLMVRAEHFIGSFSSNLSRAVHVARAGRASCSVDTEFHFVQ